MVSGSSGSVSRQSKTKTERHRKLKENLHGRPVPAHLKHGLYTARMYGCKCPICRAAHVAAKKQYRDRWMKSARGLWTIGAKKTTLCWPPRDAGPDWTCDCGRRKEA